MSLVRGLDFEVGCQEPMRLVRLKIGNLGDKPNKLYGPVAQLGERYPCKVDVACSTHVGSTNMGEYSVIGITPDCKSGALCGCRFKSYLAHHQILYNEVKKIMNEVFRLKEDLPMVNDHYGYTSGGGVAKAGMIFKLLREPTPEKKKYKLESQGVKFPYYLYLRKNDFKRFFEKVE